MKLIIAIVILMVMIPAFAIGGPYLSTQCIPAKYRVTSFQFQFDDREPVRVPVSTECGTVADSHIACGPGEATLCYDLTDLPEGSFVVRVMSFNESSQSPYGPELVGTKIIPVTIKALKVNP